MKSEWRVQTNYIEDQKIYAVYRRIDVDAVDHSGNRELGSGYMESKEEAKAIADLLNEEEAK